MKWIQWLLDNAWTVIIVGTVLAQLFQAIMKKKGGEEAPPSAEEQPREYEFEDPELAERTRKIREEIQRKITQRQRGGVEQDAEQAPAPAAYEPEAPPLIREVVAQQRPAMTAAAGPRLDTQRQAEILEQQAAWAEKLQEVQRMKASALKRTEFEAATADHSQAGRTVSRAGVLDDLHSPAALRRAFILREVLGPPVALRK
jgi:hypothetical protein